MIGAEFASSLLKLARAEEHLNTLKAELAEWRRGDPYFITRKSDDEGSHYWLSVEIRKPPNVDRWSLIAGDCVRNLRSALDTAVYAVAIRESGISPPPDADKLQFPITDTPVAFERQRDKRLASLSAKAQAWIEGVQPYNRPHMGKPALLKLLSEFDNSDKHRLLNLVLQHVAEGKFTFKTPLMGSVPTIHYLKTPVNRGGEFAFFTLNPPKRNLDYEFEGSFAISIGHSRGPGGDEVSSLHDVLAALITEIRGIVNRAI